MDVRAGIDVFEVVSVDEMPELRSEVEVEVEWVGVELSPGKDEDPDVEVELLVEKDNELVCVELPKEDMLDELELWLEELLEDELTLDEKLSTDVAVEFENASQEDQRCPPKEGESAYLWLLSWLEGQEQEPRSL